jgi:ribose transport system substrate-binding protein
LRIDGFKSAISKYPNIKIVDTLVDCDKPDTTVNCAETALSRHPDLAGYYATGGAASIGPAKVFASAGKHVVVAAVDEDPTVIAGIRKGTISFTYVQQLYCGGYLMVQLPYLMAFKGKHSTKKFVDTGIMFVDKSNVATYKALVKPSCAKLVRYFTTTVMK